MEPQEQPTKAIFSFADELQRRQQRAEEQKAVWEQKQQRAAELYRSGQNPILAYIETMKPEADPARIKRAETAAKIAAWSNMLTALGTGIVGMATEGYVPKPVPMLRCECSTGSMSGKNYTTAKTANTDN